jgi:hypothetical protein
MTSEHIWGTLEMKKYRINRNDIFGGGGTLGSSWLFVQF